MSSDVEDLINALQGHTMTLDQVVERVRQRSWPRHTTPLPANYLERALAAQQDPEPYLPGSWDEVAAAHQEGRITDEEYAALSEAVTQSQQAEDERKAAGSADSGPPGDRP
jgi:hypothetical protein